MRCLVKLVVLPPMMRMNIERRSHKRLGGSASLFGKRTCRPSGPERGSYPNSSVDVSGMVAQSSRIGRSSAIAVVLEL